MGESWLVAWVRPSAEFETVDRLKREGFDALCPAHREKKIVGGSRRHWRGRERVETVTTPAFPRYILLRSAERPWQAAERVDGVTSILRQIGSPELAAALPDSIAQMLTGPKGDGILSDLDSTVEHIREFAIGSQVRISSGPFGGHVGPVVGQEGRRVRVLLSILGAQRRAWVRVHEIEGAA